MLKCVGVGVMMYMCRCFALVGNASLEQAAAMDRQVSMSAGSSTHESIMGAGISGSVHTILVQCSPQIFKVGNRNIFLQGRCRTSWCR